MEQCITLERVDNSTDGLELNLPAKVVNVIQPNALLHEKVQHIQVPAGNDITRPWKRE